MEQDARTQKHATCGTLYQCRYEMDQVGYGKGLKLVSLLLVKSLGWLNLLAPIGPI